MIFLLEIPLFGTLASDISHSHSVRISFRNRMYMNHATVLLLEEAVELRSAVSKLTTSFSFSPGFRALAQLFSSDYV